MLISTAPLFSRTIARSGRSRGGAIDALGVTLLLAADAALVPALFVAVIVKI
jgi:hypothetical protein